MTRYLHTMLRITDPAKTRAFYEALGLEFRRDMDIVRGGEREATNDRFGGPGHDEELDGRRLRHREEVRPAAPPLRRPGARARRTGGS